MNGQEFREATQEISDMTFYHFTPVRLSLLYDAYEHVNVEIFKEFIYRCFKKNQEPNLQDMLSMIYK